MLPGACVLLFGQEGSGLTDEARAEADGLLSIAQFGYIMESGRIVLEGEPEKLKSNEDVREFYLGGGEGKKSYKAVKSYRRRKRWLS